jgi:hypothetical protein
MSHANGTQQIVYLTGRFQSFLTIFHLPILCFPHRTGQSGTCESAELAPSL